MPARTRKTTPAKPTTAPTIGVDLAALVSDAKPVAELPKVRQQRRANPLRDLVARSRADGKPYALPAVPEGDVKRLVNAIRSAATREGLGVSIRRQPSDDGGVVVILQAKASSR